MTACGDAGRYVRRGLSPHQTLVDITEYARPASIPQPELKEWPSNPSPESFCCSSSTRKWWLVPLIVVLLIVAALVMFAGSSPLAPFLYPLF